MEILTVDPIQNLIESINSKYTRKNYLYALNTYLKFLKIEDNQDMTSLLEKGPKDIEKTLINYIINKRKEGYSYGTISTWLAGISNFFIMNDIVLNKRKISKFMGEHVKTVKDRGYTLQEIKKILDCCNLKFKIVVTLMASTGCRVGSISALKISDLKYIKDYNLYKINFYTNTKDEYYSFTTPECSKYINEYLDYRKRCGENITMESPLIRNDFQQDDILQAENPKPQTKDNFEFYIRRALIRSGLRHKQAEKQNSRGSKKKARHEVFANHGFRKFVITTMVNNNIKPEIREMLVGHSLGLTSAYYKPTEKEMLSEYLKVVDELTINDENRLKDQNERLKERITRTKNEITDIRELLVTMAKDSNFPIDEFNKKFGTDF